jgi:hypothetical protein
LRLAGPIAGAAIAALFLLLAHRTGSANYTGGGDSPYYVMMARSLARDGDLVLTPEERSLAGHFQDCPVSLVPRILSEARPYCWHPIGAPVLFALPYAIAGRRGILLFVALLAACTAVLLARYLERVTNDRAASWGATTLVSLTVPVFLLAANEYTEMPALFFQVVALLLLAGRARGPAGRGRLIALGTALALIPWFHLRYLAVALALAAWAMAMPPDAAPSAPLDAALDRAWYAGRGRLCVAAPMLVSAALMYAWAWHATGRVTLDAPLIVSGSNRPGTVTAGGLVRKGLLGHLTDQQGGLLVHSPHVALAVLGWAWAWALSPVLRRELAVHASYGLPTLVLVAGYYNWSGHWGLPCRFLATFVPAIALGLAVVLRRVLDRSAAGWLAVAPPAAWSLVLSACYLRYPPLQLSMEARDVNLGAVFVHFHREAGSRILQSLPRFIYEPSARDYLQALSLLACTALWLTFSSRLLSGARRAWLPGLACAGALALHHGVSVATAPPGDPLAEDPRWEVLDTRFLFTYPRFYETVAALMVRDGRQDLARSALELALAADPDRVSAYVGLVQLLGAARRDAAQAVARSGILAATRALGHDPDARLARGYLHAVCGDVAPARADLEEYVRLRGKRTPEARTLLESLAPGTGR